MIEAVHVQGAGKVGAGLTRALRARGFTVTTRAGRDGLPSAPIDADFIILALRDSALGPCAQAMAQGALVGHRSAVVVHCAGALGPDVLAPVRGPNVAVAQMHPMISFASTRASPSLERGQLLVDGDAEAVARARELGEALGMSPRTFPEIDRVAYHAAAGLVANGAAALAAAGVELLARAGVDGPTAAAMLGPLLRSVAENVVELGLPAALTGPVRRGDAAAVARALETLRRLAPDLVPLYVATTAAQIPVARAIGEEPAAAFEAIANALVVQADRKDPAPR